MALIVVVALLVAPRAQSRPNVLLITLDTVRADRMGFLGSKRGLTPSLDALARESVVFTRAYAQAPITTVSHATLLSGTYPPLHGVRDFGTPLPDRVPYLPDVFHRAGYRTAAFVGSLIPDPRAGTAPGFDRGFDVYDAGFHLRRPGEDRYHSVERRGDDVVARALRWLSDGTPQDHGGTQSGQGTRPPQGTQPRQPAQPTQAPSTPAPGTRAPRTAEPSTQHPFFVWVHLFDAHDPYDPPGALKTRYAAAPYDGEIAEVDRLVARLLKAIGPDTVVAIAGDHGEALGDHGEDTHGVFLYDATLHVPLVLRMPGVSAARVTSRVRLADVAPTILEAAGVAVPPSMQGESLVHASTDRSVFAETDYPRQAFGWSGLTSWRDGNFLFVRAPKRELYDERTDARAATNLAAAQPAIADASDKAIDAFIRRMAGDGSASSPTPDPALARRLASLGYVGGSGAGNASIDPKDRIQTANTLRRAVAAVEDGAFQRAIPLLERVTAAEPTIPIAQLNLGVARARVKQYPGAIEALQKAVTLDAQSMLAQYELASALYESGNLKTAATHYAIVAARMPNWADARYSLGSVYARIDRVPDALVELKAALALEPRHFRANLLLGRLMTLLGQGSDAVAYLRTAIDVQPANAEAHQFLADAYDKTGKAAEAAAERRRADGLLKPKK